MFRDLGLLTIYVIALAGILGAVLALYFFAVTGLWLWQ